MVSQAGRYQCKTPVAFLVFNRPETTERVFSEIARARPPKLLVVADGPRADRSGEAALCAKTRAIIERVDWDCDILTNYSDENLGCRNRVSSGISWVFDQVSEAIFLEDDCLPDPSFFCYCDRLLDAYRNDDRVMSISGNNFQFGRHRGQHSIYFSRYVHIWGWASWRRAWRHYDVQLSRWPDLRDGSWLANLLGSQRQATAWSENFDGIRSGRIDTWDYQWLFAHWLQDGLCAIPQMNLISNIGFGAAATHTGRRSRFANMDRRPLPFPLDLPSDVRLHREADRYTNAIMFSPSWVQRILGRLRHVFR